MKMDVCGRERREEEIRLDLAKDAADVRVTGVGSKKEWLIYLSFH